MGYGEWRIEFESYQPEEPCKQDVSEYWAKGMGDLL